MRLGYQVAGNSDRIDLELGRYRPASPDLVVSGKVRIIPPEIERQMARGAGLPDLSDYESLSPTERESVVRARIGQGRFREELLQYWTSCAVTGLTDRRLLRASHIVAWSESTVHERTSLFNGLLLSVSLDAAFDEHLITFEDNGGIVISSTLSDEDASILGIDSDMSLRMVDERHTVFLTRHREKMKSFET